MKPPSFLKQTLGSFVLALAFGLSAPAALADEAAVAEIQTETPARPAPADFQTALQGLAANDFHTKQAAVEALAASGHVHTLDILAALADGHLFASGNAFYIQNVQTDTFAPIDAPDTAAEKPEGAHKITVNNKIRQWVRHYVAENALLSSHPAERKAAMMQMLQKNDASALAQVQTALPKETDKNVRALMETYIARADLQSADTSRHAAAIAVLDKSGLPENLSLLQNYVQTASTPALKAQAQKAISSIETKLDLLKGAETLSFGLSLGSVLVLTAIGLAITFGVMGVINMAHGELMMIGAYCAYVVQLLMPNHIGWSIAVAIPVAFLVSGFVGVLIERFVVRYLYGRPLETLLATFGISLILQQAVRSVFSPLNRLVQSPEWMSGAWEVMPGLSITWNRVYIFIFCLLCFFTLLAVMKRTRLGLEVRAVSQNRHMARAMGISDRKVDMLTFGLGSGIAGVAGVALSQLTNVGPNLGQQYIVDSFMVVVVGGVGNLWGTLVSGLTLGVLNKLFEPWLGAVLAKAIVLVLIILFIQKYPRGLFPQKGRGVE
ncbi:urea ABC transporter permease subunit UrtB [Uruburuella suis]|uniref:Amino acid/amide ABC transporter membrane protein 1 (HAAT family) n=1 Tax=Uruburuella suis TaxID=252130 RepID=A0AAE9GX01_9NEIS|nr:urea ABC transporter permease subunit UrtB [Uruburuella suis]TCP06967.1 amino acid/amide ABC transporter membrane protein 1 (HAAT family) [Uruburuella suis]UOO79677.1 urea ABC transporter permease subunit UrtB [Uruburuella suis]